MNSYDIIQTDIYRDDFKIYGLLYKPQLERFPLVIICHGLGGSHEGSIDFAHSFASNGIGAYIFDFCGGGPTSKSDGKTTEMSVLTETRDLEAIIDHFKNDPKIDTNRIFLMGKSQGAFVSTIVLSRRPDQIAAFIGLYPGYVLEDLAIAQAKKYEVLPETMEVLDMQVGSIYLKDLLNNDIYSLMKNYKKDVLLMHGTDDSIVPISYAQKASHYFPNSEFISIKNAEHGFHGPERNDVIKTVLDFVLRHC